MNAFEEEAEQIILAVEKETSKDPITIALHLMKLPGIPMHGPIHHMLDGSAFLAAYKNAGGKVDLDQALRLLVLRAETMPGATCGYWGICGSAASVGAALSIIHQSTPISSDEYYKDNLRYTSRALSAIGEVGGPRCCKRNAYLSLTEGVKIVQEKYSIPMEIHHPKCEYPLQNPTCLKDKCPFYKG